MSDASQTDGGAEFPDCRTGSDLFTFQFLAFFANRSFGRGG